jgi:hypothetical protein
VDYVGAKAWVSAPHSYYTICSSMLSEPCLTGAYIGQIDLHLLSHAPLIYDLSRMPGHTIESLVSFQVTTSLQTQVMVLLLVNIRPRTINISTVLLTQYRPPRPLWRPDECPIISLTHWEPSHVQAASLPLVQLHAVYDRSESCFIQNEVILTQSRRRGPFEALLNLL